MTFTEHNNSLEKIIECHNFEDAIKRVNKIANIAETINHHPDIHIYDYKFIKIILNTHDAGNQITEKDRYLAKLIDNI